MGSSTRASLLGARTGSTMQKCVLRGPARAIHHRANLSFFILIIFFSVFGVIVLTKLFMLERPRVHNSGTTPLYNEELQMWEGKMAALPRDLLEPPPPERDPRDAEWQPVGGTRFKFYVYSAYWDWRRIISPVVRIIAATKTRGANNVVCKLNLFGKVNRTITLEAVVQTIRENFDLPYSAAFVFCFLGSTRFNKADTEGATVSVIASIGLNKPPTNLLKVLTTEKSSSNQESLHVCVKPIHFSYGRDDWLLEWLELNRLLGVSHFYMYNQSMSKSVACVLQNYIDQGHITMLQWKLPIQSGTEIRTVGIFASLNDCLYRSMTSAAWLLVIDFDEVVLPRRERTLTALLTSLSADFNPQPEHVAPAAFLFRNVFFYLMWEDDKGALAPLLTARKTRRSASPQGYENRSKYAARPHQAVELGNHFLWKMLPQTFSMGVPPDRGLLHHYRLECEYSGTGCLNITSTVDRTAHRWAEKLTHRIATAKLNITKMCPHV